MIAPDYRGSTGYGCEFYELIDYGGRENEDVLAARNWMLETHAFLDPARVGILGWSHGGMISLMSDLVARMGYKNESYRRLFSAPYHIGKSAADNVNEYLKRSPVTHAAKLATPLLVHTNTNAEDYKIYENAPGGHVFNRIDTKLARESRREIWAFLAKYLRPGN